MRKSIGTLNPRTQREMAVLSWWSLDGLVGLRRVGSWKRERRRGMRMAVRARLVVDGGLEGKECWGEEGVDMVGWLTCGLVAAME